MLILTVIFAVLNICLGFALAMYLGFGSPRSSETRSELGITDEQELADADNSPASEYSSPTDATSNEPIPDSWQAAADNDAADTTANETAQESHDEVVAST